jgi:hypothetical protein
LSDGTIRTWDVPTGLADESEGLAGISETIGGVRVINTGGLEQISGWYTHLRELSTKAAGKPSGDLNSSDSILRWLFTDPYARTISPFSTVAVDVYVQSLIDAGARDKAQLQFPGHRLLR